MVPIPEGPFLFTTPHPYVALGASYGGENPWMLRKNVLASLTQAQETLAIRKPGWKLKLFDAYRPNDVQAFMVEWEFRQHSGGHPSSDVPEPERTRCYEKTFQIWGIPSEDPKTPPPHSTGAAVDLTIADADGREIDMGSPIDENSERSVPDYYAQSNPEAHANRQLLHDVMAAQGFRRHRVEWWHFSKGDQMWAWLGREEQPENQGMAIYGRAALLPDEVS
ncbi:MAG: M15 family metallopeptidase [Alphaproteobacteria bacterium]